MFHLTHGKSLLPALLASLAAAAAPSASAAIVATINTFSNTVTLVVNDGSWISAIPGDGQLFRNQTTDLAQLFARNSNSFSSVKTGGVGDWDPATVINVMANNNGNDQFDPSKVGGLQLVSTTNSNGLPTEWSGTINGTFNNLSAFTSASSLGYSLFGSTSEPITVESVPEPSAAVLGLAGAAALVLRRRRQTRGN